MKRAVFIFLLGGVLGVLLGLAVARQSRKTPALAVGVHESSSQLPKSFRTENPSLISSRIVTPHLGGLQHLSELVRSLLDNRALAMETLRGRHFADLLDPGVAKTFAAVATDSELELALLEAEDLTSVCGVLFPRLSQDQLRACRSLLPSIADRERRKDLAGAIAEVDAGRNFSGAVGFASSLPTSEEQAAAYAGLIDGLRGTSKTGSIRDLYGTLTQAGLVDDRIRFSYSVAMIDEDPSSSIAAITAIQDPSYRNLALMAAARSVESSDPAVALKAVTAMSLSDESRREKMLRILGFWMESSPDTARQFIERSTLIDSATRNELLRRKN